MYVTTFPFFSALAITDKNTLGDVADDRFFHKSNDSDATQFSLLYPRIAAHGELSS
jgi:hypothetical protein